MEIKKLVKKSAAASISLCMLGGAMGFSTFAPEICSIAVHAEEAEKEKCYSFNEETGELTFKGNVDRLEIDLDFDFDTDKVKNITAEKGTVFDNDFKNIIDLYRNCESIDLKNADLSGVKSIDHAFAAMNDLTSVDISGCDLSGVKSIEHTFANLNKLKTVDMSGCDLSNVTDMSKMFSLCPGLTTVNLSNCSTGTIKDISNMFNHCTKLSSLDLSGTKIEGVENMSFMFSDCETIKSLDLSNIKTTIDASTSGIFFNCPSLESIDMSGIFPKGSLAQSFMGCDSLKELRLGEGTKYIAENSDLTNDGGWVNVKDKTKVISGTGKNAVFDNEGANTYVRLASDEKNTTLYGDANCDGIVDLSDAVIIMQAQSNPAKFGENGSDPTHMTAQGVINGDVSGNGDGITSKDALTIQKYLLGLISSLPESN